MSAFANIIQDLGIPGYGADELDFIHGAVGDLMPDIVFDWGTNRGSSARILYESLRFHGLVDTHVHTIDLPRCLAAIDRDHARDETGEFVQDIGFVHCYEGDGVTIALTIWCELGKPTKPLFFIDGDHSYENVVRELRWLRRACPRATLLMHDTRFWPGDAANKVYGESHEIIGLPSQAGMILVRLAC